VSRYQKGKTNLDFTESRNSEWQWHQLGHMQVSNSLQTDNHASTPPLSFLQAGCPSCHPTNSVNALKAELYIMQNEDKTSVVLQHSKTYNLSIFSGVTRVPAVLQCNPAMRQCSGQLHIESAADRPERCPAWRLDEEQSDPDYRQHSPSNPNSSQTLAQNAILQQQCAGRVLNTDCFSIRPPVSALAFEPNDLRARYFAHLWVMTIACRGMKVSHRSS